MELICEVSMRHVHLTTAQIEELFGKGKSLTPQRMLSQPGQFLAAERVDLVGPKGTMQRVAIIGPERSAAQVELSRTDCFVLGIADVPLRQSGDLGGSAGITIKGTNSQIKIDTGVILAHRHVHLDPDTAKKNGLDDGQIVSIKFEGDRQAILCNTIVRVDENFAPAIHIDSDEANAVGFDSVTPCTLLRKLRILCE